MIKRILLFLVLFFIAAIVFLWLVGGGIQKITVAIGHYRSPHGNIIEFITGTGSSSVGELFHLPGTPSSFPTLTIPEPSSTTYYYQSSGSDNTSANTDTESNQEAELRLQQLEAQYQALQQQAQQRQNAQQY